MGNSMTETVKFPSGVCGDALTEVLRAGAQRLLAEAVRIEAEAWVAARADQVDAQGHRQVVRNGYLPERHVMTGIGMLPIRQPRVEDRRPADQREAFDRKILPPYLRRTQSLDEAIPWMYLYGISTNDMSEPLESLLGPAAKGVSASTVSRLVAAWQKQYADWNKRSLGKEANHRLRQIWMAATKADANKAFDMFIETYQDKYSSAVECLKKDRERLLTFYDFPAKHWTHIRTSNPIESMFSTVRLRHNKTRNNASRVACLAMVYKLGQSAQRNFQRLNGAEQMKDVVVGIIYEDGIKKSAA